MTLNKPKRNQGGFTLVEIIVAAALVGMAVTALLVSVASNTRVNDAGTKLTQGTFLAQEIREWTLSLPFSDPDPADQSNPPGSDGTSPQTWVDDLDDLMDVTYCPPRDGQGYAISSLDQWSQTITLTWRSPNDLTSTVTPGASDIIYVNVDVKYRNRLVTSVGWLVTRNSDK